VQEDLGAAVNDHNLTKSSLLAPAVAPPASLALTCMHTKKFKRIVKRKGKAEEKHKVFNIKTPPQIHCVMVAHMEFSRKIKISLNFLFLYEKTTIALCWDIFQLYLFLIHL
jgi:hypothetical protein